MLVLHKQIERNLKLISCLFLLLLFCKNHFVSQNVYYSFEKERLAGRIVRDEKVNQFEELQLIKHGEGIYLLTPP